MAPPSPIPKFVYKILDSSPPSPLPDRLPLSPLDAKDGFIHLSTAEQVPSTAARFFSDCETLWILRILLNSLEKGNGIAGAEVRWEESRSHSVFAHLYGGGVGREDVDEVLVVKSGEGGWEGSFGGLLE